MLREPPLWRDVINALVEIVVLALPLERLAARDAVHIAYIEKVLGILLANDMATFTDLDHGGRQLTEADSTVEVKLVAEVERRYGLRHWFPKALDLRTVASWRRHVTFRIWTDCSASSVFRHVRHAPLDCSRDEVVADLDVFRDHLVDLQLVKRCIRERGGVIDAPKRIVSQRELEGVRADLLQGALL